MIKFEYFRENISPVQHGDIIGAVVKFDFLNYKGERCQRVYVYKEDSDNLLCTDATNHEYGAPTQLPRIIASPFRMFGKDDYRRKVLRKYVYNDPAFINKILTVYNYPNLTRTDMNSLYANLSTSQFERIEQIIRSATLPSAT